MKHYLCVGHFDPTRDRSQPTAVAPIDLARVIAVLSKHCDAAPDGTLTVVSIADVDVPEKASWIGTINRDDVYFTKGYLLCPWLDTGVNHESLQFIAELQQVLSVLVFAPDDGRFYTPQELSAQ
jgi:hypothetical protein